MMASLFMPMSVMLIVYWIYLFPILYIYQGFSACLILEFL